MRRAVAFGMRVIGITRSGPDPDLERRAGLAWTGGLDRLDEALSQADVVSLHVPYSSETRHILDARRLGLIRPGGVVVNVSRGGLIDELALLDAVRSGHLAGAGLDVVEGEPAPPDHPLRGAERIVMATHVAGATDATAHRRARFAALNVSRVRYGLEPLSRVDGLVRGLMFRRCVACGAAAGAGDEVEDAVAADAAGEAGRDEGGRIGAVDQRRTREDVARSECREDLDGTSARPVASST